MSNVYKQKVDVINVVTAPEVEMLIICNEEKYKEFKNSGEKPGVYCKNCKNKKVLAIIFRVW